MSTEKFVITLKLYSLDENNKTRTVLYFKKPVTYKLIEEAINIMFYPEDIPSHFNISNIIFNKDYARFTLHVKKKQKVVDHYDSNTHTTYYKYITKSFYEILLDVIKNILYAPFEDTLYGGDNFSDNKGNVLDMRYIAEIRSRGITVTYKESKIKSQNATKIYREFVKNL